MGPDILSSAGAGVWRKAPRAFPDSNSVLDDNFNLFQNSLKILNVYFWGDNVYFREITFTFRERRFTLGETRFILGFTLGDLAFLEFLFVAARGLGLCGSGGVL